MDAYLYFTQLNKKISDNFYQLTYRDSLMLHMTQQCYKKIQLFFRFGKRYEIPLLIQSLVMNMTMFGMIHLCVNVRKKNQIIRARERIFTGWYK